MPRTLVFYHIFCGHTTPIILSDQIHKIHFSGLYKDVDKIYCFLAGYPEWIAQCYDILKDAGKKFHMEVCPEDKTYERLTLYKIRNIIQPEDNFLYMHTKGISKLGHKGVHEWRTLIEYHVLYKYRDCLEALKTHDCAGINWHMDPQKHFSGNMWWSTGAYYLSLPETIGPYYCDPEFYIGLKSPNVKNFIESGVDHYHENFPYRMWVD